MYITLFISVYVNQITPNITCAKNVHMFVCSIFWQVNHFGRPQFQDFSAALLLFSVCELAIWLQVYHFVGKHMS